MPSCKFCGATEKLTGEHVFPNWIRTAVGDGGAHFFRRKPSGEVDEWQTVAYSTTVKDVCATCNNGWMKRIEDAVAPILPPMITDGASTTLDNTALRAIATWIALRSLVVPLAAGPEDIPTNLYRAMHATHAVPDNSAAWLGLLEGTDARTAFFLGVTLNIDNTAPDQPDAYLATMAIGKFVTRVFTITPNRGALGDVVTAPFDEHLGAIWPTVDQLQWPPRALDVPGYTEMSRTLPKAWVALNLG